MSQLNSVYFSKTHDISIKNILNNILHHFQFNFCEFRAQRFQRSTQFLNPDIFVRDRYAAISGIVLYN
ncbi:MAG: hypothetical protein EA359_10760 [Balneolaceae bacterium]|nr:MAG: hypothetical protein EA359_10760 [Balneolaceae bacterium]